jgi:prephenate dehydrogenase
MALQLFVKTSRNENWQRFPGSNTMKVRVIGAGLIGTSIALALKQAGCTLQMVDIDPVAQKLANKLVDGRELDVVDVNIISADLANNKSLILKALKDNKESIVIDIASVKSNLLQEIAKLSENRQNFVSSHPMAGREVGGGHSARADLFKGRAWIGIESDETSQKARESLEYIVKSCGATLYWFSDKEHDEIVARISHLPQVISSSLGNLINESSGSSLNLAGQGLRDVMRLAASDAHFWSQLLIENANSVSLNIKQMINKMQQLDSLIESGNQDGISKFLIKANDGFKKIPGKHGLSPRNYALLSVVINDEAGQLAKIFNECAEVQINIEDLSIEHSPGQLTGLITLSVAEKDSQKLSDHLSACGWDVFQVKSR